MSDLYKKLVDYGTTDFYPYHMPGHKRSKLLELPHELLGIDITEIEGFDDLHNADGLLLQMQQEAAALYGAEESFILVNGSTAGILSAVMAATKKGNRLVMARNCHKSVYHAAFLQELRAVYLYPELLYPYRLPGAISPKEVEEQLTKHKDAAAVIITSPTYEGIVSDVRKIAEIAHRFHKPLIVDEAHGAHFGMEKSFPETAVRLGADLVIQSMHKMLPAMTQTALLHVNGKLIDRDRLSFCLSMFQTSSPSYVLMASADSCISLMREDGKKLLKTLAGRRQQFDETIKECDYMRVIDVSLAENECIKAKDPGKILITTDSKWMTGSKLYDILIKKYHLQMEMAAGDYVLALVTVMDGEEAFERLQNALFEIDKEIGRMEQEQKTEKEKLCWKKSKRPIPSMTITKALEARHEMIPLKESIGRTAAAFIHLYPPGIPFIAPGEKFNHTLIKEIMYHTEMGLHVRGIGQDNHIKVTKKEKRTK